MPYNQGVFPQCRGGVPVENQNTLPPDISKTAQRRRHENFGVALCNRVRFHLWGKSRQFFVLVIHVKPSGWVMVALV